MIRSGLIGRSILASRSPWLHEQEARAQGLELTYELFDFSDRGWADEQLPAVIHRLRDQGFAGFNVTYPFKQAIIPHLDELGESARIAGAVNTVAIRNGRLTGHNTDMSGFAEGFRQGLPDARLDHVVQIGCGGAGAAVASALIGLGVGLLELVELDVSRAQALADRLNAVGRGKFVATSAADLSTADADGIVNATPVGMASHPGLPITAEAIAPHHWVADVIYFPLETQLLAVARAKGCRTLNGIGMVVNQAAQAFSFITGHDADATRMRLGLGL